MPRTFSRNSSLANPRWRHCWQRATLECVSRSSRLYAHIYITTHTDFSEDEEVKAAQVMNHAMSESNHSYTLLHVQCEFLRCKGKHEWALRLARQAVNSAPSEFVTWEMLTQVYIDLGEYESVCGLPRSTRVSIKG